jgi:hypothetical protein
MSTQDHNSAPNRRVEYIGRAGAVGLLLVIVALIMMPAAALGQAVVDPTPTPQPGATATTTPVPKPAVSLSTSSGLPGASITANGLGFRAGEAVDVTFNGQSVGTPNVNDGGTFSLAFTIPNLQPGKYGILAKGQSSGFTATSDFTINQGVAALKFSAPQTAPGVSLTVTGTGFQPGETVQFWFNGATVGTSVADTSGGVSATFVVPTLAPGSYDMNATGGTSNVTVTAAYPVIAAAAAPVPAAAPTATPVPAAGAVPNAPAIAHDERYFGQTGYRIENDQVWGFFQQYGGPSAFGYPVSRTMSFLGCPVQMFQRHIIQVCPGSGPALINLLDPEIFPYTQVNGSTFPGPDPTIKNNTPQVGSPTYAVDINAFVQTTVPDVYNGAQVNFLQTFNALGGLTIWGAPISNPAPEPSNPNFIYQRFQRGIMHFIAGSGTQSILLADYLKAIMMSQNVPSDLLQQSRETRFFSQYCPGQTMWLCRPNDLPGTDLTFAFVNG